MKKSLFSTKTIVATGLGGALFMVLFMFVENKYFLNNSIIFIKGYSIMLFIIIISLVYLFGIIIKKEDLSNIEIVFKNPCISKLR